VKIQLIAKPQIVDYPHDFKQPAKGQYSGTEGERIAEIAGRGCYMSMGKGRDSKAYHENILEHAHGSTLEHAQYVFRISGVSRGLTHELVRHRAGTAVSQRSTRYVNESKTEWIKHPLIEGNDAATIAFDRVEKIAKEAYLDIMEALVSEGVPLKQARGAARGVLGNALETSLTWSANIRAIRNIVEQRAHPAADAEIREFGMQLLAVMKQEAPVLFADYTESDSPDGLGKCAEAKYRKV